MPNSSSIGMSSGHCLSEFEESESVVNDKVRQLARLMRNSKCTLVYTGAGISTAAEIPDYRGPNGVWTLASQGKEVSSSTNMTEANPTVSHMILKELYRKGRVKHILSQNCDGLHLRSGLPQKCLSEIHGNMYIEVCKNCKPVRQFIRAFDVTEKSKFRHHQTGRFCTYCNSELLDTIVHFGEVGKLEWPLNWKGTTTKLDSATLILCIGTSLNVLKSYKFLWPSGATKTKLVIVNLQWTPKDKKADIVINAKSDVVLRKLAEALKISPKVYCRECDPILGSTGSRSLENFMNKIHDCSCSSPSTRSLSSGSPHVEPDVKEEFEGATKQLCQPGWWTAGIQRMKRKSASVRTNIVSVETDEIVFSSVRKSARVANMNLKKDKRRGRPRKKAMLESPFERDVRLTVVDILNEIDPVSRRSRGRPKLATGQLKCEKEGYFKFEVEPVKKSTTISPAKDDEKKTYDSEDDAEELSSNSDDDTSVKNDPSFRIPRQQLMVLETNPTFICSRRRSSDVTSVNQTTSSVVKQETATIQKETELELVVEHVSDSRPDSQDLESDLFNTCSSSHCSISYDAVEKKVNEQEGTESFDALRIHLPSTDDKSSTDMMTRDSLLRDELSGIGTSSTSSTSVVSQELLSTVSASLTSNLPLTEISMQPDENVTATLPQELQSKLVKLVTQKQTSQPALIMFLNEHITHPALSNITIKELIRKVNVIKNVMGDETDGSSNS